MSAVVPYQPNAVAAPRMRFACSICTWEVASDSSYEAALNFA